MNLRILISIVVVCTLHHVYSKADSSARLAVARVPSYLNIDQETSGSKLTFNDFKRLLTSMLGYSIDKSVEWDGMTNKNPISVPNAVMIFLGDSKIVNMDEFSSKSISIDQQDKNIDLDSFDSLQSLDGFNSKILKFKSLEAPEKFPSDCRSQTNPEVYVFNVDKSNNKEMTHEIDSIITKYQNDCSSDLVALLLTHEKLESTRVKRQVIKDQGKNDTSKIDNPAPFYGRYYPATFNLFFWTSLILGLALFAIGYGMWNMDPGVDTVIYRMTSQRIKKDQ